MAEDVDPSGDPSLGFDDSGFTRVIRGSVIPTINELSKEFEKLARQITKSGVDIDANANIFKRMDELGNTYTVTLHKVGKEGEKTWESQVRLQKLSEQSLSAMSLTAKQYAVVLEEIREKQKALTARQEQVPKFGGTPKDATNLSQELQEARSRGEKAFQEQQEQILEHLRQQRALAKQLIADENELTAIATKLEQKYLEVVATQNQRIVNEKELARIGESIERNTTRIQQEKAIQVKEDARIVELQAKQEAYAKQLIDEENILQANVARLEQRYLGIVAAQKQISSIIRSDFTTNAKDAEAAKAKELAQQTQTIDNLHKQKALMSQLVAEEKARVEQANQVRRQEATGVGQQLLSNVPAGLDPSRATQISTAIGQITTAIAKNQITATEALRVITAVEKGEAQAFEGAAARVANAARRIQTLSKPIAATQSPIVDENIKLIDSFNETAKASQSATFKIGLSWEQLWKLFLIQALHTLVRKFFEELKQTIVGTAQLQIKISEIQTISQDAQQSTDKWASSLRALSSEFGTPVLDVAAGMYETISNQIAHGAEASLFMRQAMEFAKVTVSSTKDSVNLLSSALNSFHQESDQTQHSAEILFETIVLGRVRAEEMANSFGRLGALASPLGIHLDELGASIATLTRQGVKYDEVQTLMSNVMIRLIKPSEEMKRIFKEWGVSSGEAAISTFSFFGVMEKLSKVSDGSLSDIADQFKNIRAIIGDAAFQSNFKDVAKDLEIIQTKAKEGYAKGLEITKTTDAQELLRQGQRIKNFFSESFGEQWVHGIRSISEAISNEGLVGSVKDLIEIGKIAGATFITNWMVVRLVPALLGTSTSALKANAIAMLINQSGTDALAMATREQATAQALMSGQITASTTLTEAKIIAEQEEAVIAATRNTLRESEIALTSEELASKITLIAAQTQVAEAKVAEAAATTALLTTQGQEITADATLAIAQERLNTIRAEGVSSSGALAGAELAVSRAETAALAATESFSAAKIAARTASAELTAAKEAETLATSQLIASEILGTTSAGVLAAAEAELAAAKIATSTVAAEEAASAHLLAVAESEQLVAAARLSLAEENLAEVTLASGAASQAASDANYQRYLAARAESIATTELLAALDRQNLVTVQLTEAHAAEAVALANVTAIKEANTAATTQLTAAETALKAAELKTVAATEAESVANSAAAATHLEVAAALEVQAAAQLKVTGFSLRLQQSLASLGTALTNPLMLITAALVATGYLLYKLHKSNEEAQEAFKAAREVGTREMEKLTQALNNELAQQQRDFAEHLDREYRLFGQFAVGVNHIIDKMEDYYKDNLKESVDATKESIKVMIQQYDEMGRKITDAYKKSMDAIRKLKDDEEKANQDFADKKFQREMKIAQAKDEAEVVGKVGGAPVDKNQIDLIAKRETELKAEIHRLQQESSQLANGPGEIGSLQFEQSTKQIEDNKNLIDKYFKEIEGLQNTSFDRSLRLEKEAKATREQLAEAEAKKKEHIALAAEEARKKQIEDSLTESNREYRDDRHAHPGKINVIRQGHREETDELKDRRTESSRNEAAIRAAEQTREDNRHITELKAKLVSQEASRKLLPTTTGFTEQDTKIQAEIVANLREQAVLRQRIADAADKQAKIHAAEAQGLKVALEQIEKFKIDKPKIENEEQLAAHLDKFEHLIMAASDINVVGKKGLPNDLLKKLESEWQAIKDAGEIDISKYNSEHINQKIMNTKAELARVFAKSQKEREAEAAKTAQAAAEVIALVGSGKGTEHKAGVFGELVKVWGPKSLQDNPQGDTTARKDVAEKYINAISYSTEKLIQAENKLITTGQAIDPSQIKYFQDSVSGLKYVLEVQKRLETVSRETTDESGNTIKVTYAEDIKRIEDFLKDYLKRTSGEAKSFEADKAAKANVDKTIADLAEQQKALNNKFGFTLPEAADAATKSMKDLANELVELLSSFNRLKEKLDTMAPPPFVEHKASGGLVFGQGGVDKIPAFISNGEYVMNAESTKQFFPLLEQMNFRPTLAASLPSISNISSSSQGDSYTFGDFHFHGVDASKADARQLVSEIKGMIRRGEVSLNIGNNA